MTRILLTISRTWTEWSTVRAILTQLHEADPTAVLVHGDNPKCDRVAAGIWKSLGGVDEPHPAYWKRYGKGAGMRRNEEMVRAGADVALAFILDESPGASHCAAIAEANGIDVRRIVRTSEVPA